jgi:FkbM family methyltransferase
MSIIRLCLTSLANLPMSLGRKFSKFERRCWRVLQLRSLFCTWGSIYAYLKLVRGHGQTSDQLVALKIRALDGESIVCRPSTTDCCVLWDTFIMRYHMPPNDLGQISTILDLGSNIGTTIAHFAFLFPNARILGVEPEIGNLQVCRLNTRQWGNRCKVLHGAVWPEDGVVTIEGKEAWGFRAHPYRDGDTAISAYGVSHLLDELGAETVDFIKMDIEGAEMLVLKRAQDWITRVRCLKVEVHLPYSVEECISDLTAYGFRCAPDETHPHSVVARRMSAPNTLLSY